MKYAFLICSVLSITFLGCSKPQNVSIENRAALVVEEFNASPACTSIKLQLLHQVHDEAALNKAYAAAQKLRCLKGDV